MARKITALKAGGLPVKKAAAKTAKAPGVPTANLKKASVGTKKFGGSKLAEFSSQAKAKSAAAPDILSALTSAAKVTGRPAPQPPNNGGDQGSGW